MKLVIDFSGRYFVQYKFGRYEIYLENDGTFTAAEYHVADAYASELTYIKREFKGI